VQGAGHVGARLAHLLLDSGARVLITDVDADKAAATGVPMIAPEAVHGTESDVFAPCALGGVVTVESAATLRCAVVCGAANNQLADAAAGDALAARSIVYAPDYVVNAGGIINISHEWTPGGYSLARAQAQTAGIEATTRKVLELAHAEGITPGRAANEMARRRIAADGKAPYRPGEPSVMRGALLARHKLFE
jgi:glutamate dehydrogenase/leucine dehydrogenase